MLSLRGHNYAALDLAAGYTKERGSLFDKVTNPDGLVSLTMAENVCAVRPFIELLTYNDCLTRVLNAW